MAEEGGDEAAAMDISNGNEGAPAVDEPEAEIDVPEPEPEAEVADVAAVMEKKVWGKFGKHMWPAEKCDPPKVKYDRSLNKLLLKPGKTLVMWYGTRTFGVLGGSQMEPFVENREKYAKSKQRGLNEAILEAVEPVLWAATLYPPIATPEPEEGPTSPKKRALAVGNPEDYLHYAGDDQLIIDMFDGKAPKRNAPPKRKAGKPVRKPRKKKAKKVATPEPSSDEEEESNGGGSDAESGDDDGAAKQEEEAVEAEVEVATTAVVEEEEGEEEVPEEEEGPAEDGDDDDYDPSASGKKSPKRQRTKSLVDDDDESEESAAATEATAEVKDGDAASTEAAMATEADEAEKAAALAAKEAEKERKKQEKKEQKRREKYEEKKEQKRREKERAEALANETPKDKMTRLVQELKNSLITGKENIGEAIASLKSLNELEVSREFLVENAAQIETVKMCRKHPNGDIKGAAKLVYKKWKAIVHPGDGERRDSVMSNA